MLEKFSVQVVQHNGKHFVPCEPFFWKEKSYTCFPLSGNFEDLEELPEAVEESISIDFEKGQQVKELLHVPSGEFFEYAQRVYISTDPIEIREKTRHALCLENGKFYFQYESSNVHPAKISWKEQKK